MGKGKEPGVGNGQSCEAVGNREACGPVPPALPWCANMGQAVGGQGSHRLTSLPKDLSSPVEFGSRLVSSSWD